MSNFLLKNPDCVLIHIPKTAGTSIRKGVWERNYEPPVFGTIPQAWNGYFKFAFIRHPLQRLVSAYNMFTYGTKGDPDWRMPADAKKTNIYEFVKIVIDDSIIYDQRRRTFEEKIRHHTIPQTHPFNCLDRADFIGRLENFDNDFKTICTRLGINKTAPKIHTTTPTPWQTILKGKALEMCIKYYMKDFNELGYDLY